MPTIPSWWNIYYQCKIHLLLHLIFVFTEIQIIEFSPNSAVIIDQNIILYFVCVSYKFSWGLFCTFYNFLLQTFNSFIFILCSVQLLSHVQLFATPWTAAHQASLSITNSWSLLKLMSIESVMPSNHLILCRPLLPCLQSFPASGSFQMSQLFASGGQSIGVSPLASFLPKNTQG